MRKRRIAACCLAGLLGALLVSSGCSRSPRQEKSPDVPEARARATPPPANAERKAKDVQIVDILSPPAYPDKYVGEQLKPVVSVRNAGTDPVASFRVDYFVGVRNNGSSLSAGPPTTWLGRLSPGETIEVQLEAFGTPLPPGAHYIELWVGQIDGEFRGGSGGKTPRVFALTHEQETQPGR